MSCLIGLTPFVKKMLKRRPHVKLLQPVILKWVLSRYQVEAILMKTEIEATVQAKFDVVSEVPSTGDRLTL